MTRYNNKIDITVIVYSISDNSVSYISWPKVVNKFFDSDIQ